MARAAVALTFREERRQLPPPEAPPFTFPEAHDSWQLVVAPAARPSSRHHGHDWESFFLMLRDPAGRAAERGAGAAAAALVLGPFSVVLARAAAASR